MLKPDCFNKYGSVDPLRAYGPVGPLGVSERRGVGSEEDTVGNSSLARLNSSCSSDPAQSSESCSSGSSLTSTCDGSDFGVTSSSFLSLFEI